MHIILICDPRSALAMMSQLAACDSGLNWRVPVANPRHISQVNRRQVDQVLTAIYPGTYRVFTLFYYI